jgi:hypothetical protein
MYLRCKKKRVYGIQRNLSADFADYADLILKNDETLITYEWFPPKMKELKKS